MFPYLRVALHDFPGFFVFKRVIWDYEIIYIENGIMILEIEGKTYTCEKGDIIFLRPGIPHVLRADGIVEQPHIHFDFNYDEYSKKIYVPLENDLETMTLEQKKWIRKDFLKENGIDIPYVMKLNNSYSVRDLLLKIIDAFTYDYPYSKFEIPALVTRLCVEIFRSYDAQENISYGKHQETFDKLLKYINQHANENISLDDLSEYVQLSKFYLIRIFKKTFGKTPEKYIANIRLKKAKELIQFTKLSMKEIAYEMSFDTPQSFSRWFKNLDGKNPNYYRNGRS